MNGNVNVREDQIEAAPSSDDKISNAISRLLEHPELISMVASTIGMPAPSFAQKSEIQNMSSDSGGVDMATSTSSQETDKDTGAATVPAISGEVLSSVMPMLSKLSTVKNDVAHSKGGRHEALLCALKPYLSEGRSQAVDYIIKLSQVSEILGKLR